MLTLIKDDKRTTNGDDATVMTSNGNVKSVNSTPSSASSTPAKNTSSLVSQGSCPLTTSKSTKRSQAATTTITAARSDRSRSPIRPAEPVLDTAVEVSQFFRFIGNFPNLAKSYCSCSTRWFSQCTHFLSCVGHSYGHCIALYSRAF